RRHRPAHHPVPGGGRPPGRRHRGHRSGHRDRHRHSHAAQGQDRRPEPAHPTRRPRPARIRRRARRRAVPRSRTADRGRGCHRRHQRRRDHARARRRAARTGHRRHRVPPRTLEPRRGVPDPDRPPDPARRGERDRKRDRAMTPATFDLPAGVSGRPRRGATASQILSMAWRQMVRIRHNPFELVDLSLSPVMFLLLFVYVFGGQLAGSTADYLQYVLGGLIAQNSIFLTMYTGTGINADLRKGVYDRFRSLPIARSAPLAGKIFADLFKQVWSVAVMLLLGMLMGFELRSAAGALLAAVVIVVFALAISWVSVLLGVLADSE